MKYCAHLRPSGTFLFAKSRRDASMHLKALILVGSVTSKRPFSFADFNTGATAVASKSMHSRISSSTARTLLQTFLVFIYFTMSSLSSVRTSTFDIIKLSITFWTPSTSAAGVAVSANIRNESLNRLRKFTTLLYE